MTRWLRAVSKPYTCRHALSPIPGENPRWSCSRETRRFFLVVVISPNRNSIISEGARHQQVSTSQEGLGKQLDKHVYALAGKVRIWESVSGHSWLQYVKHPVG